MRKPRIGLVGYFGYGNYGDELFLDVYRKYLYDCELVILEGHPSLKPADDLQGVVESVDAIIIGGGDLFIPKYYAKNYLNDVFHRKPIYFHGVGVPLWTGQAPDVVKQLSDFVQHDNVKWMNVRDPESADWVKAKLAPKVEVHWSADMVFSLDFPAVPLNPKQKVFGLVMRHLSVKPEQWARIAALCDRARGFGYEIHNIILGAGPIRDDDLATIAAFDYAEMKTIDPNDIGELTKALGACDVIASTKFHGCVVAAAYGRPAITLTTTDKFNSLCRLIERPDLRSHIIHEDLVERLPKYMAPIPLSTRVMLRSDAVKSMERLRATLLNEEFYR